jgi:hypothetical protein
MKKLILLTLTTALLLACTKDKKEVPIIKEVPIAVLSLNTAAVTGITNTEAISGGTIISDGGSAITGQGICYSTNANPTINDTKLVNNLFLKSFTSNIKNLAKNTKYYARAYAINSKGIAYGNEISFTTANIDIDLGKKYKGGIVAYIDGTGYHGLIAATSDDQTKNVNWYTAVQLCSNYSIVENGITYDDWRLPNLGELHDYLLPNRSIIGGFKEGEFYWSDFPEDPKNPGKTYKMSQTSAGSNTVLVDKISLVPNVRAVRAF